MLFKDISNFNNLNDYLPILNGCINADLIIMFFVFHNIFGSKYLKKWYKKYQLSAVIADVLILFIGIIISRFMYPFFFKHFNIVYFSFLTICIQIIHDILFYLFFSNLPIGYNAMLDFFKLYAKEVSFYAILGDSLMILIACLLSSIFANQNMNINIITLIISLYFIPYVINYR